MPNLRKSKFVRRPKSIADLSAMQELADAVNALLNCTTSGCIEQITDSNRTLVVPKPKTDDFFFPFKIYQIDNVTDSTLSKYTFQIRDGLIGMRTQYPNSNLAHLVPMFGNFEAPMFGAGTDNAMDDAGGSDGLTSYDFSQQPTPNTGGNVTLNADGSETLIFDNSNPTLGGVQIVIPQVAADSNGVLQASFWIKIFDDPDSGTYSQLWGKVAQPVEFSAPQFIGPAFNGGMQPNGFDYNFVVSIALGGVVIFSDLSFDVTQFQYGHLLNRYLQQAPLTTLPSPSVPGPAMLSKVPQVFRGYWLASGLKDIADAGGILIYPGDVVVDDTNTIAIGGKNFYWAYVYNNSVPGTEIATPGGSSWVQSYLISDGAN